MNKSETTEYQREVWLKANYGMTPEDYSYLLDSQGGVCAICKRPSSERLRVDHNHLNGLVRGLLCRSCNAALGMLAADAGPEMIQSALEYVSQPPLIIRKAQKYEQRPV